MYAIRSYYEIGVDALVRTVDRHIVILVAVARIDHDRLVEIVDVEQGANLTAGIVVSAVGEAEELQLLARNQVLDYMPAAIAEP